MPGKKQKTELGEEAISAETAEGEVQEEKPVRKKSPFPRKKTAAEKAEERTVKPIGMLSELECTGISTGWGLINHISGHKDFLFPRAAISEVAGLKSASKTTLILETIAFNQMVNPDFRILYADFEHAISNQIPYLHSLGVDTSEGAFTLITPPTMEEGTAQIHEAVKSGSYDMIVVDSIAAMRPKLEVTNGLYETKQIGVKGKIMAEFMRNTTADMAKDGPALVFINQLYKDISAPAVGGLAKVQQYVSPSTDALAYYAAIRFQVTESTKITKEVTNPYTFEKQETPVGSMIKIKTTKNKIGMPHLSSNYVISYGRGIDIVPNVLKAAMTKGIVVQGGSWFTIQRPGGDGIRVQGMANLMDAFYGDPELVEIIGSQISEDWAEDTSHYLERLERRQRMMSGDNLASVYFPGEDGDDASAMSSGEGQ